MVKLKYRDFGEKIDWKPSALGFGLMRLPILDDDFSDINEEETKEMIKYAIDHGVNYFDTAWPYHEGESEAVLGRILDELGEEYRDKVKLATKMPSWDVETQDDLDKFLNQQLEKLRTDCIDFYLLHGLDEFTWNIYQELDDIFGWIEKVQEEGKIDHIGFSFHGNIELFKEIVDSYDWDFCQIQYNYIDQDFQAGREGLKYAADKGLGVIIMEPLRGGQLAAEPPETIKSILEKTDRDWPPVSWALHWLWSQPEVSLVLSGMSEMSQLKENVEIASNSEVGKLSEKEFEILDEIKEKYEELSPVGCTGCNYCGPCPEGVFIPDMMSLYNQAEVYGNYEFNYENYHSMPDEAKAFNCVSCKKCEEKCPQDLPISDLMDEIADYFSKEG